MKGLKVLSVEESMKRMKDYGVKRIIISYKDSAIGRCVLSFENGKFTRTISIKNNPRLTSTFPLNYKKGVEILYKIVEGIYTVQSYFLVSNQERNVQMLRKEVV